MTEENNEDEVTALYRYFDAEGRLLYVGITIMPMSRQKDHKAGSAWYPDFSYQTVEKYRTRADAMKAEREAIKSEKPMHNITYLRELRRSDDDRPKKGDKKLHYSRQLAGRMGAFAVHSAGKTNTGPGRAAFMSKFEREVDPDGVLDPLERARRAEYAKKAYFTRLQLTRWAKRRRSA